MSEATATPKPNGAAGAAANPLAAVPPWLVLVLALVGGGGGMTAILGGERQGATADAIQTMEAKLVGKLDVIETKIEDHARRLLAVEDRLREHERTAGAK